MTSIRYGLHSNQGSKGYFNLTGAVFCQMAPLSSTVHITHQKAQSWWECTVNYPAHRYGVIWFEIGFQPSFICCINGEACVEEILTKFMKNVLYFPSLEFVFYFDSSTEYPLSDKYSGLEVEDFLLLPPFKWKENLGKIILCMNFFCDTSWVWAADFCSRVWLCDPSLNI